MANPESDDTSAGDTMPHENNTTHGEQTPQDDTWIQKPVLIARHERDERSGFPPRKLGVTWRNLTVEAVAAEATIHENVVSQFDIVRQARSFRRKRPMKTLLDRSHGCVKPGEMLLVLGRPGSGCTTLLSVLANRRRGYASITGDVHYGSMDAKEAKHYRGQIVMNTEEELFYPTLTVKQTIDFATRLKTPFRLPEGISSKEQLRNETRDYLLRGMGIEDTASTKVGDEFVRGVSGGERKRVSLIECMATNASVYCWDNSTRGLDASMALEYAKAIRAMTDILGLASIVTLYQAGNGIYELFDKVLILEGGHEMFYGPLEEARPFMEGLGFICQEGSNVADYLTGVTVPTERLIRPDCEKSFPHTGQEIRDQYEHSEIYKQAITEYDYPATEEAAEHTRLFKEAIKAEKSNHIPASSVMTVSFQKQVKACIMRQYQILWGDKATLLAKQISVVILSLIAGSLFYDAPNDSTGLFLKSGALFFSLLYNSLLALSEVTASFTGRPVLTKHKSFALYHPAAFCFAQIAADIPILLVQISNFSLILYFMVGLTRTAGDFFTFWIILFATTMVGTLMVTFIGLAVANSRLTQCITAMFRAIGASFRTFGAASKVSGLIMIGLVLYSGYFLYKPTMHPWFVWIFWIDPLAYAFDALLSNEMHGKTIPCESVNLVPFGPGYGDSSHQACAGVLGALPGESFVLGDNYLKALSYSYDHLWRNFGIVWAWWFLFVVVTIYSTSRWRASSEAGSTLLIPREKAKVVKKAMHKDLEAQEKSTASSIPDNSNDSSGRDDSSENLMRNTSVFTWKNLSYTVNTPEGERKLLDNVQGWVRPGMLGALMGISGAGKTTLLDVLAQRKTFGTIHGSILVDGRPLPVSFQRSAGYCEQLDVHEPHATVREALEFSALLRQKRDVPREEKLKYVDVIIDLLELNDLADTLIGHIGDGLTVEQRKRVTIGVELVSKPSILIFLDEPTSGLDGQSAFNTVRFLRKLADAGQSVLVTIHQPSAQLFAQFDTLLLLTTGGRTVYFGDIGDNGQTVKDYFARYGAPCPADANPAEHMIDVVSGHLAHGHDWSETWLASPEHKAVEQELDHIITDAASKPPGTVDDGHEFALPLWDQIHVVTKRMNLALFRDTNYVNNKFLLHIFCALFNGFTFWKLGDSVVDLQLRLFAIFNLIFVVPGTINQLQPLFIERRDIFETREKKSKTYSWISFVTALIVSEVPYLVISAVLYFVCWYYTVGFPRSSDRAGATFFVVLMYEFIYTGIGQFIAAYAPNAVFASLINPFVIGILLAFCGVLVPYRQIQAFWRYWLYYINPFNYLMGSMLVFDVWGVPVRCTEEEFAYFRPPAGKTCGEYLAPFLHGYGAASNLTNPESTTTCKVCQYRDGSGYLRTVNLNQYYYGWRDAGIVVIFVLSSYGLVYGLMKLRTKASKKAE